MTPAETYADRIARTPEGVALGRTSLVGPLRPVADGFAYVWTSADEASTVAERWAADRIASDREHLTAARTADAMGTATAAESALVAAADAVAAEYAETFPNG